LIFWIDMLVSLTLPFLALAIGWKLMSWVLQHTTPSAKTLQLVEEMGPAEPPIRLVDAGGNVRHEWAADLHQQRLRKSPARHW
jgi:hypothetical protein